MIRLAIFALAFFVHASNGQGFTFNFEISLHVKDEIRQLLEIGMRPVRVLHHAFSVTRLYDPHDFNATRALYYHLYTSFPEAQALYCSFEDGKQVAYVGNNATIPLLYLLNGANCSNCRFGYAVDSVGTPTSLAVTQNYDARNRTWYQEAKAEYLTRNVTEWWSVPIFFVVNKVPGVIFTKPLTLPSGQLDGLIAINYALRDVSLFLNSRYGQTTRTVFIVDHPTGYLLGCSEDTPLFINTSDMIFANMSFSSLVSGAMLSLQKEPSPEALVIVAGRYIQSTLYTDAERNIHWRIVVIMPAKDTKDFIGWTDPTGIGIVCMAVFAVCVSLTFLVLVFKHREARIVKMSQVSFINIFLIGGLLLNVSIFFELGENTPAMCALRAWFSPIMLALTIAPLVFKMWWMYVLFSRPFATRPPTKSAFAKLAKIERIKVVAVSMTARTAMLVLVECFILLAANLLNSTDPVETTKIEADGFYSAHVYCGLQNSTIIWINNIFFASLLFTACILAFKARNINENLAESRSIALAIYSVSLFALIVQIIRGSQELVLETDAVLSAVGLAWGTTVSTLLVLGPRFVKLFSIGDDAACAWLQAGRSQHVSSHLSASTNYTETGSGGSVISMGARSA